MWACPRPGWHIGGPRKYLWILISFVIPFQDTSGHPIWPLEARPPWDLQCPGVRSHGPNLGSLLLACAFKHMNVLIVSMSGTPPWGTKVPTEVLAEL